MSASFESMEVEKTSYAYEIKHLLLLGWPMTISQLCYALLYPTTLAFCGTMGTDTLDIATLGISIFQLVSATLELTLRFNSLGLIAQALGGTKKFRVGIIVQRSLISATILWFLSLALACNTANLLILIGQYPELAVGAESFVLILMPGCLAMFWFRVLTAYMDALGHVFPTLFMNAITFCCCLAIEYLFVIHLKMGYQGAAAGLSISLVALPIMMIIYIVKSKVYSGTWSGWNARCFLNWKDFYKNFAPAFFVQLNFVFSNELGSFLAGIIGKTPLAVQGIVFQLFMVAFQPIVGFGSAGIARIGKYLGSGNWVNGKRVFYLVKLSLSILGVVLCLLVLGLQSVIPKIFSADEETTELFRSVAPFVSVHLFLSSVVWGSIALMRASNLHVFVVMCCACSAWLFGQPIGISLMFATNLGLVGLWIGMLCTTSMSITLFIICICRMNWTKMSSAVSKTATKETDVEFTVERAPLIKKSKQKTMHLSDKSSQKQRSQCNMCLSKLWFIIFVMVVLGISIIIRISFPPVVPFANQTIIRPNNSTVFNSTSLG